jgi:hypothetical protein
MSKLTRRKFVEIGSAAVAALAFKPESAAASDSREHSVKLAPTAFLALPLGEIRPSGWLRRQLRIQADGLSGHLDEFWPDVGPNSGWAGGTGESWERGPYFVDGLLPLAWQLDDERLKAKAMRFIDWTLNHQSPSGMIGPAGNDDWWPRMVMCKVLAQYHDATGDPRVIPVLTRYFHHQLGALPTRPLREWGKFRWQDQLLVVEWLHERTGDSALLRLASLLEQQGYDWIAGFANFRHTGVTQRADIAAAALRGDRSEFMQTHGVNNGQALKTAAVRYRLSGELASERANFNRQMATLDRFHGLPNGMFSCDEHLAGLDPSHGTELCTVVETLYSLEVALATFGDAAIGDRIEKIAFNALPGTFDDAMWSHQYDQQPNQIQVGLNSKPWTTNGPESNLYGLEPNFGCCTANFHQGWPKFTASLWMRSPDGGLVATLYAPCQVATKVGEHKVALMVETEYPFKQDIRIHLSPETAIRFPLRLRIPAWAHGATIQINGRTSPLEITTESYALLDRLWTPGDLIDLHLPMLPTVSRWYNESISLMRGPLVFSFEPGQSWVKLRDRGLTADWQVFPEKSWNYALLVDEQSAPQVEVVESPVESVPFAARTAPVKLRIRARRVDAWRSEDGVAAPVPKGLQTSNLPEEVLELIPYAAAKLRISAFPQLHPQVQSAVPYVGSGSLAHHERHTLPKPPRS